MDWKLKENNILSLIGRTKELFQEDIQTYEKELSKIVSNSTFLVIGGAGSIGQAVTKEISFFWIFIISSGIVFCISNLPFLKFIYN